LLRFLINNEISIIPAALFGPKAQILDLHGSTSRIV
jgi:hypothetical protein